MTIIDSLLKDYDQYLNHCLDVLTTKMDILDLDYSNGETDRVRLLFIEKKDLTMHHAVAILTLRLMMFEEEWNDLKNYKKEDFERWIRLIEKQYKGCLYEPNIEIEDFKKDFFVERLTKSIGLKNVKHNTKTIDFLAFKRTNLLFHEKTIAVSKTMRKGLQEEFYIETTHHFILFNWYTTG
jgi:hypothetical protein